MPFGFTNVSGVFMVYMNMIFNPYFGQFVVVFINDILVYFKSKDKHLDYQRIIFQTLKDNKLYAR